MQDDQTNQPTGGFGMPGTGQQPSPTPSTPTDTGGGVPDTTPTPTPTPQPPPTTEDKPDMGTPPSSDGTGGTPGQQM